MTVGAAQGTASASLATRVDAGGTYTVKSGDTLWDIARAKGVSLQSLIAANPQIANPDLIFPKQVINIPGGSGGTATGSIEGPRPNGGSGGDVLATAQKYLGQSASALMANTSDGLPMQAGIPNTVCCANFVSAVLIESGQLPPNLHTNSVSQLNATLRAQGWTEVPAGQAQPGDVVIIKGGGVSHTEIYAGDGKMIGSNNTGGGSGPQEVSYGNLSWALGKGAVILRAPAGAQQTGGPAPTGGGTRQERIDQAVRYFEGQGWSHAQAIGIVANLDAESGMDPNIRQHGGGPGYGLAQWENPRQRDFAAWAGKDIRQSTFQEQLEFIQHELTHSERGAGNRLRGADNPREAAEIVTRYYERPADTDGEAARRGQRAADMAR